MGSSGCHWCEQGEDNMGGVHRAHRHSQGIAQVPHSPSLSSRPQGFRAGPPCLFHSHRAPRAAGVEPGLELLRATTHK